jgi:hypothetical protein
LRQQPRLVFLIDCIGATVSAFFLGVVLTALEGYVGMPPTVLSFLTLVALADGAYSIGCYYLLRKEWRRWLRAISSLNLAYCGVTAGLVVAFRARLTFVPIGVPLPPRALPFVKHVGRPRDATTSWSRSRGPLDPPNRLVAPTGNWRLTADDSLMHTPYT